MIIYFNNAGFDKRRVFVRCYYDMSIKSDLWIRRMADEQQMITPFLPELLREVNGNRIISAGASSYGYDMRLADDGFRVFSPIRGFEIDPKSLMKIL